MFRCVLFAVLLYRQQVSWIVFAGIDDGDENNTGIPRRHMLVVRIWSFPPPEEIIDAKEH